MRKTGEIVTWFGERKFGFVRIDNSDEDVFFHQDRLCFPVQKVKAGVRVSMTVEDTARGSRGVDVQLEKSEPTAA